MKRRYGIVIWTVLFLVWGWATVRAEVANQVVAVVGDNVITMLDLEKLIGPTVAKLRAQNPDANLEGQVSMLRSQALEQMVVEFLTTAEAERLGIKVNEEDVEGGIERVLEINKMTKDDLIKALARDGITIEEYKEQIHRQILRARLVYSSVKAKIIISEKKKRELYDSRKEEYQTTREIELKRIVLPPEARNTAEEIKGKVEAGADFAEMAKEFSRGPEASEGGLLGFFKVEQLSQEIRTAVDGLKKGQLSKPVETKDGLQIFMISDVKVREGKSYEEVEPVLAEELLQKEIDKKFTELLNEIRKRTYIKVMRVEDR